MMAFAPASSLQKRSGPDDTQVDYRLADFPPAPAPVVERILDASAAKSLERFAGTTFLSEGKVNLIGLDAIADRLADRWPARRDQVYAHVERTFERQLSAGDYWLRVSDRDYLVVQPAASRFVAQAFCLTCLRELLRHFLGEAEEADVRIRQVTGISAGGLEAVPVDAVTALAVDAVTGEATVQAKPSGAVAGAQTQWSPFVTADGRSVRVSCALEPVIQLKTHARIGFRLARRVILQPSGAVMSETERQQLSRADIERIDLATIVRGLGRLQAETGTVQSLTIPVSFISLSNQSSRALLSAALREATTHVARGVICEVVDIEGVPPGTLLAVTSLIRPFCFLVVGGLREPGEQAIKRLRGSGLQGLSFECPAGLEGDAQFIGWARAAIGAAKHLTRSVLVHGLSSPRRAAIAEALGATHASFAPRTDAQATSTPVIVDE